MRNNDKGRIDTGVAMGEAGIFRTTVGIAHLSHPGQVRELPETLVDVGSELTWMPRTFLESLGIAAERWQPVIAVDGKVQREIGFAIVRAGGRETADIVVFAEPGDAVRLGARSLSGLNFRVDAANRQFVDAGPIVTGITVARSSSTRTARCTTARRVALTHS